MKNAARLKMLKCLILFLMVICYIPPMLAQQENPMIGTWNTTVMANGVNINIKWIINKSGASDYVFSANGQTWTERATWSYQNGILYEVNSSGQRASGYVSFSGSNLMKITIIDNGVAAQAGQVRIYTRSKGTVSFKGTLECKKCKCKGWNRRSDGKCECGHTYAEHRRPGE